jgi:hypothetical protein
VEFTVLDIPCLGLNGGPAFKHTEDFSFQIATEDQGETDHYWNAIISNGGTESQCGLCKDRWGLSWQIIPRALTDALAAGGGEATRAFEADQGYQVALEASGAAGDKDCHSPRKGCERLVVVIEGGLVQTVVADRPEAAPVVAVIDYEAEGFEPEDLRHIAQSDGSKAKALVVEQCVESATIDLDEVFQEAGRNQP